MSALLATILMSLAAMFPVSYSADSRYLVDRHGKPFPILGRSSWFIVSMSRKDIRRYLDDCVSKGFNSVEMHVLNHDVRGNHPPFNGEGNAPFVKTLAGSDWKGALIYGDITKDGPDFTSPNEAYWRYVDSFLDDCQSKGVLVFLFPVYVGYNGDEQGWMKELTANGPQKAFTYGKWIAARFSHRANLVWMLGGDLGHFTPQQLAVETALAEGLKSVPHQLSTQFCAEWDSESIATDQKELGKYMTLNGAYSWQGDVNHHARRAYAQQPPMPSFLLEEPYDEEGPDGNKVNPSATQPVRRFQWAGMLGGIGGYIAGNGYIWPFVDGVWQTRLDTKGANDMAHLNAFVRSIEWWKLKPSGLDGMKNLVDQHVTESEPSYVSAAASPGGNLLVAYVPPAHTGSFAVDLSVIKGAARARWFNPSTGTYTQIGNFPNTGLAAFNPPGDNGSGFGDWVLIVDRNH